MAETKTALLDSITEVSEERQRILNLIPGLEMSYFLKRKGIKKDLIIGMIGERGGGKSGSSAVLGLIDFAMDNIPIHSNMKIACEIVVDDSTAQKYGLSYGGIAIYRSVPIDMPALLRFDEKFRNTAIYLDEINVEVSEARRAMSNTNLFSNRLTQELRHLEAAMLFTCLSEMSIDPRLRDVVDCFIRCEETAYFEENIAVGKPQGIDFQWTPYFMNKCFNGHSYSETKKHEPEAIFHFKPWRGIYDDKEFQGKGMVKYGVDINRYMDGEGPPMQMDVSVGEAPNVRKFYDKWGWFEPIARDLLDSHDKFVEAEEVWNNPEVKARRIDKNTITRHLKDIYNIRSTYKTIDCEKKTYYELPDEKLFE